MLAYCNFCLRGSGGAVLGLGLEINFVFATSEDKNVSIWGGCCHFFISPGRDWLFMLFWIDV